jgi:hypothetical protein
MQPHYYLMKSKKILRLEADVSFLSLPTFVQEEILEEAIGVSLNQQQANWRVVIFRDEIMEYEEYFEWLQSPEARLLEEC